MGDYANAREERLKRNKLLMAELGLIPVKDEKSKMVLEEKIPKKKQKTTAPALPSRRSSRKEDKLEEQPKSELEIKQEEEKTRKINEEKLKKLSLLKDWKLGNFGFVDV